MSQLIRLCLATCLVLQGLPSPAFARQPAQGAAASVEDECTGASPGQDDYPYDTARVREAFRVAHKTRMQVSVLVVDNGFIGYAKDPATGIAESKNYPGKYFYSLGIDKYKPFDHQVELPGAAVAGEALQKWGHGTHVAGLILGGDYRGSMADGASAEPDVRRLFDMGQGDESWLQLFFAQVADKQAKIQEDPFKLLVTQLKQLPPNGYLGKLPPTIVNASLAWQDPAQARTDYWQDYSKNSLIVAAAGNDGLQLSTLTALIPAQRGDVPNVLTVASYDADHQLSAFSNYGARYVDVAAPGCKLRSWLTGASASAPMNGTSMAAALVSFTASLVRRVSGDTLTPELIAQRIMTSGRFSEKALNCGTDERQAPIVPIVEGPLAANVGCVRFGSELDIVPALFVLRDYIEWCANGTPMEPTCELKQAVGNLQAIPASLKACLPNDIEMVQKHDSGLSLGGAVRRARNLLQLIWLRDQTASLEGAFCKPDGQDVFTFQVDAKQPSGRIEPHEKTIKASSLVRIVVRSIKSDG